MATAVDTAVVGAGLIGLATAHALCRDGQGTVALFDRGLPGSGDSGRSFSMVRRHYSNPVTARLAMAGARTIVDWADEVGGGDSGYVRCGYLLTVPERLVDACRGNVQMLRGLGLDTRFLARDEIAAAEPLLELDGIAGAAYEPDGGFADAQKMCNGWFAVAASRGLDTHLATAVRGIRVKGGRVAGLDTDGGFVAAGCVVLATGAWANDLLDPLGARQPLQLRRLQVAIGSRRPGEPLPSAVCSDSLSNVVVRPDRGREFCAVAYTGEDLTARADDCDHELSNDYEPALRRGLGERYPGLNGFRLERGWAGLYDVTPDWNPIIGPCPGIDGLHLAFGTSGHGFKLAPAIGEVTAAEASGRTPPVDVADLRPQRFPEGRLLRLAYGPGARA